MSGETTHAREDLCSAVGEARIIVVEGDLQLEPPVSGWPTLLLAGLIASVGGAVFFVVAVAENRDAAVYLAVALTLVGALSAVIAGVVAHRSAAVSFALLGFVPVTFVAWMIWRLATDNS